MSFFPKNLPFKLVYLLNCMEIVEHHQVDNAFIDLQVSATVLWDSSIHDSVFLNRVTQSHERVYLILKVSNSVTQSHERVYLMTVSKQEIKHR